MKAFVRSICKVSEIKSIYWGVVAAVLVSMWTVGSAQAFQLITRDLVEKEVVTKNDLIQVADNFIILFDTSGSTNDMVPGKSISRIKAAKTMLQERNTWFPELEFKAGLFIYTDNSMLSGSFKEVYGVQPFDRGRFAAAIDMLPDEGRGPTMMQAGLGGLRKTIAGLSGKTAIIMFTDGTYSKVRGPKQPLQIAQEIARDYDACFYLISSANSYEERNLLAAVSQINACSRVIPLSTFMDNSTYLSGALYTVKTSSEVRLKPYTEVVGFSTDDILFDFDSHVLRGEYNDKLEMMANFLSNHPDAFVVASGYTDSAGDEEYNLALSERRAASVKNYLTNTLNIDDKRILTLWFGELNPVADNATSQGQQLNRRVEIALGAVN